MRGANAADMQRKAELASTSKPAPANRSLDSVIGLTYKSAAESYFFGAIVMTNSKPVVSCKIFALLISDWTNQNGGSSCLSPLI
jgi:hypothetical protein